MEPSVARAELLTALAGDELNAQDNQQEDLWRTILSLVDGLRQKLVDSVRCVLQTVLKLADSFLPAISSIVSAVTTLLTNVITLAIQHNSTSVKVMLGVGILAALTSFISNVSVVFNKFGPWAEDSARSTAAELVTGIVTTIESHGETIANSMDFRSWITIGISSLVAILFAGLGFTKAAAWRDLITGSQVIENIKKTSNNAQSVADFILRDVVGLELDKDYPECLVLEKLAEEGAALQQLSVADLVQQPDKLYELRTYVGKVVKATSARISNDNSRRYATTRQLLVEIYRQLSNKLDAINAILATKPRQVTVGLMLSGAPGHGKSEFGKYICKRVARALGYPTSIYCLNKKADGFYEPYGGSAIGVFNEFMAMRDEDAILRDLNLILSSDPMNFEAACIEGKSQPCQLKLVFLTSNAHNPDMIKVLSEGAVKATWDRIYHIAVDDPLCKGRHFPNEHRKPDFSHLNFQLVHHDSPDNITMEPISFATIEQRLIGRCASAELDYLREILSADPEEAIANGLVNRLHYLRDLKTRNSPYDVIPNALGREFFITRLQGLPGSGKSTLAEQLAKECSTLFSMPVQYSRCEAEFIPLSNPAIYVLDDWVEQHNIASYVQLMNRTHERSMFYITSNTVFERVGFRSDFKGHLWNRTLRALGVWMASPWDATQFDVPQGALRRLGLQGYIKTKSGLSLQTPEEYQKTYNFLENFVVSDAYGRVGNREAIMETIFRSYRVFLARPSEFCIIRGLPPLMNEPTVTLSAPTARRLIEGLRSPKQIMDAYLGRLEEFTLKVHSKMTGPGANSQTMVNSWIVVEEPSDDPAVLESIWSRMCATFGKTFPGESLLLKLTDSNSTYYYEKGVSYIFDPSMIERIIPVEFKGDSLIYHRDSSTPIIVTAAQYVAARLYNQFDGPMYNCTATEYRAINQAFSVILTDNTHPFSIYYRLEEARSKASYSTKAMWLKASLRKSPVFWMGVSLLSLVCAGGTIFGFIKLCQAVHYYFGRSTAESNTLPPKESRGQNPARAAIRSITPRVSNSDGPRESRGKTPAKQAIRRMRAAYPNDADRFLDEGMESYATSWLIGNPDNVAKVKAFLRRVKDDGVSAEFALQEILWNYPEDRDGLISSHPIAEKAYSNMLRMEDMIKQDRSPLEVLYDSIRGAYVHLSSDDGVCYGIHLKNRVFLTVSHLVDRIGEEITIRHDGEDYSGVVVYIDRARDISLIKASEQMPQLIQTLRFFASDDDLKTAKYGFMLRCGPQFQLMGGVMNYYTHTTFPITSEQNPNYSLSERLIVHIASALNQTRDFIKAGDCGFPLVARVGSGYKILGIHNGYNQTEKSYFSSMTFDDAYKLVQDTKCTPNADVPIPDLHPVELVDVDHVGVLPSIYCDALQDLVEDTKYEHYSDKLHILGFSKKLMLSSKPKGAHRPISVPGLVTAPLTLPAAYTLDHVNDVSAIAHTASGQPSPLFTQCLKYDANLLPSFDPMYFDEACGLVESDCVMRYGGCRFLSLYEAINGIPNRALPCIETRTSAGPLLKLTHKIHTKAPIFKVVTPANGRRTLLLDLDQSAGRLVRQHYQTYRDALFNECMPPILISKDCAKVELIDASKAQAGKVRLFNEIDLSINLLMRTMFGDLSSRIMENHIDSPIRMGQNPYVASTAIFRQFNEIEGDIVSTDFSGFDKQIPAELIFAFCRIASRCIREKNIPQEHVEDMFMALARSLTYVIHTCGGTIYLVDRGNESGSFVTTILNSISVDILTKYTMVRKWWAIFKFIPTLSELHEHHRQAILGDDRAFKASPVLEITQDDFIRDSKLFCLKCTPSKTDSGLDFCSRAFHWDPKYNITWPALKVSSVTSQLHWTTKFTEEQLLMNCDNALFEAALHPDIYLFQDCLSDAITILRHYNISLERLAFHSRDTIRKRFVAYVFQTPEHDALSCHIGRDLEINPVDHVLKERRALAIKQDLSELQRALPTDDFSRFTELLRNYVLDHGLMANPDLNPIGAVLELLQAARQSDRPQEEFVQVNTEDKNQPILWQCVLRYGTITRSSVAPSKKVAKIAAYKELYNTLLPDLSLQIDAERLERSANAANTVAKNFLYKSIEVHLSIAYKISKHHNRPVYILVGDGLPSDAKLATVDIGGDTFRYYNVASGRNDGFYVVSQASQDLVREGHFDPLKCIYLQQPRTYEVANGRKIAFYHETIANSNPRETPIEPVAQVGVQDNPGTSTVPHLPNPQPTAVTPAMAAQDPSLVSALEPLLPHEVLNPIGPPNMLGVGGITFDIKDLIYSQYLDCDVQYQYTDDTPQGQIIFQIPYDPTSPYVNPYIRQWLSMHPRYTGALNFRFTVVGNSTFSGLIGFAWYPYTIKSNVVKVSEMMKYSYTTMGINEPSNRIFTLFDARQSQFWRDTGDDPSLNPRPVLVCFVYMTAVSPLKSGITIRIRVASKLSDGSDGPCFVASHPVLPASSPGVGAPSPTGVDITYVQLLVGMPVVPVIARPILLGRPMYLTIDGLAFKPLMYCSGAGDYIVDQAENYAVRPSLNQGGTVWGAWAWQKLASNDTTISGVYILDITKVRSLIATSDTDPSFLPTIMTEFYNAFNVMETGAGINKPLMLAADIVSKYVPVYQVANYLIPADATKAGGHFWDAQNKDNKIVYTSVATTCIYTQLGPIFISALGFSAPTNSDLTASAFSCKSPFHSSYFSITQIQAVFPYKTWTPENMPSGWRNVSITADPPFVTSEGVTTFQSYNHESIQTIFEALAINTSPTQCIETTISDLDSGTDLAFIRYLPDRKCVVINLGDDPANQLTFGSLIRPLVRCYISRLAVVERSNSFPISLTSNFAGNTVNTQNVMRSAKAIASGSVYNPVYDGKVFSNSLEKSTQTDEPDAISWTSNTSHQSYQNFVSRSREEALADHSKIAACKSYLKWYYKTRNGLHGGHAYVPRFAKK